MEPKEQQYIVFTVNHVGRVGFYLVEATDSIDARCKVSRDNMYTPSERIVDALSLDIFLSRNLLPSGFLFSVSTKE